MTPLSLDWCKWLKEKELPQSKAELYWSLRDCGAAKLVTTTPYFVNITYYACPGLERLIEWAGKRIPIYDGCHPDPKVAMCRLLKEALDD